MRSAAARGQAAPAGLGHDHHGSRTGSELDAEVIGYLYKPGGPSSGEDPVCCCRSRSRTSRRCRTRSRGSAGCRGSHPMLEEILADGRRRRTSGRSSITARSSGTSSRSARTSPTRTSSTGGSTKFKVGHEGEWNAYKTLFLASGADVKTVGADMKQVDFSAVQGHGETRICAAARVPPIIVGLSEGLDSATYSNYGQARRAFADLTMRPLWRNVAGSLARIVDVPRALICGTTTGISRSCRRISRTRRRFSRRRRSRSAS
jgi:hypothetical protein